VPQRDRAALAAHVRALIDAGALAAHASDVVQAWRIAHGDAAALAWFEAEVTPEIAVAARKIDRDPAFVDEVCQRVRVRLLIGETAVPPRIASYRGTGPLRGWVAVAAMRVAINAKRDGRADAPDVLAEVVDREPDPELRHLKTLYRAEFRDALTAAIATLPDRDRALLRMRFVAGLELAPIGKLYRVHESTASRWIAAALEAIAKSARERLVAKLAVTAATAESVARMVQSQLDLSIARLLQ
jgi:RNA polymerase sigma-70 factor, ECF subfamily